MSKTFEVSFEGAIEAAEISAPYFKGKVLDFNPIFDINLEQLSTQNQTLVEYSIQQPI